MLIDFSTLQALPEFLAYMNSSYAATVSGGRAMNELASNFRMNAFQEGLCIPKHVPFNPVTEEIVNARLYEQLKLFPSVKAVLSFLEPEDIITFKNAASSSNMADDYFWLLVSNSTEEIDLESHSDRVEPAQNFLIVQPHHVPHVEFRQYFLNKTIDRKFENPFLQQYIENIHNCYFDAMKPGHSKHCNQLQAPEIEREYRDTPRVSHVMKSLKAIITSVEDAWTRKCRMRDGMCKELADLNPEDLMKYLSNVKTSFGKNRRELMSVRFSDGIMSRGVAISILSFGPKGTRLHQVTIKDTY